MNGLGSFNANGSGYEFLATLPGYGIFPNTPLFSYTPSSSLNGGIDPAAFASAQSNLFAQEGVGLSSIQNTGFAEFSSLANLFSNWGNWTQFDANIAFQQNQQAINKSAKAGGGLFGLLGL